MLLILFGAGICCSCLKSPEEKAKPIPSKLRSFLPYSTGDVLKFVNNQGDIIILLCTDLRETVESETSLGVRNYYKELNVSFISIDSLKQKKGLNRIEFCKITKASDWGIFFDKNYNSELEVDNRYYNVYEILGRTFYGVYVLYGLTYFNGSEHLETVLVNSNGIIGFTSINKTILFEKL